MSRRVTYPLEQRRGLLFLRVSVGNGQTPPIVARLLVDTGSSFTVLSTSILQSAGCDTQNARRTVSIVAAGGVIQAPAVQISCFNALGNFAEQYSVVGLDLPRSAGVDGLLGIDFLRLCGAVIDVQRAHILVEENE